MNQSNLQYLVDVSCKRIAPAWPLKNFVAVNPYSGFTDTSFSETAKHFAKRGNIRLTMPISFYLDQVERNIIGPDVVSEAFQKRGYQLNSFDLFIEKAKNIAKKNERSQSSRYTLTGIVSEVTEKDWNSFMIDRISSWAASYFDEYVALWNTSNTTLGIFQSWKEEAQIDRSQELMGLANFRSTIKRLPDNHSEAIATILKDLKVPEDAVETYLHAVLLKTVGWSSYISGLDYSATVYNDENQGLQEFLAILLAYEYYFMNAFDNQEIKKRWYSTLYSNHPEDASFTKRIETELILQDAYDIACQQRLTKSFQEHTPVDSDQTIDAQMVFCIDVRSEVYRRNLETVNPRIETVGFAGFFGFSINYIPLGHSKGKNQCPVLIPHAVTVKESFSNNTLATRKRKTFHQIEKTWKKFKSGAVTSFGYVSPLGISFLPKLILNSTNITRPVADPKHDQLKRWFKEERILDLSSITLEQKVTMAAGALTGMGIKDNLSRLVLIAGHGSTSVNNPHASGLDCGACGGHSGEINALTAAQIFNDSEVRRALKNEGIEVPKETLFVACLHDTTTDEIEIINENFVHESHKSSLLSVKASLKKASEMNRIERSKRLNIGENSTAKIAERILGRSKDWSETRPEWGLAGCNAFVIAPRSRTVGLDLKGKSFLHSYDHRSDPGYAVLEAIMTAPMVVTSWINLQYYASSVDNLHFGSGNKTLHNVAGGIGVLEGSAGDLRIGLPLQSVHNGEQLEHMPQRLNVVIEAPIEAINGVLGRHQSIRQLCDNQWISLLRLDQNGEISHRYDKDCTWQCLNSSEIIEKQKLQTA